MGLREEFDLLAQAEHDVREGSWVDPDLLANGWLAPRPAWGDPRHSRLSEDEQGSEFTLRALARSPLIEGANLTQLDGSTRALMTDRVLLRIDQQARLSQPVPVARLPEVRVWKALTQQGRVYVAIFNLNDHPTEVQATWSELGLQGDEQMNMPRGMQRTAAGSRDLIILMCGLPLMPVRSLRFDRDPGGTGHKRARFQRRSRCFQSPGGASLTGKPVVSL